MSDDRRAPDVPLADERDRSLDAEKREGVYLLDVRKHRYEGYTVHSRTDFVTVNRVTINGNIIGTQGWFETECDDFVIDGDTLDLRYDEPDDADEEDADEDPEEEERTCSYGRMTQGIPNCHRTATHTGGRYYPGPVCEDHATEQSEPLDDPRERAEWCGRDACPHCQGHSEGPPGIDTDDCPWLGEPLPEPEPDR